ncbi:MAG: DNA topoisomerase VI subunit B [Oligoflexales bacterium]
MAKKKVSAITKSSTAEYFAKNLQQVGFSSPVKAVLTTLKEAVDNSLDACEDHQILPEIEIIIKKLGAGALRNTDRIELSVEDNGPGLDSNQVPMVFGEYLASSKFGKGRCSRGQQGIGISAATTWALQTSATGAKILTKCKGQRKALSCMVVTDLKNNKGIIKNKEMVAWDKPHGTKVSFQFDGRLQLNGEGGILAYIRGNLLLNPHMSLRYQLPDMESQFIERISGQVPTIPPALPPHLHTMKLGEFISHAHLFNKYKLSEWLKRGFSRVSDKVVDEILSNAQWKGKGRNATISSLKDDDFKKIFSGVQKTQLRAPSTQSVMAVGEDALALSIQRLGATDYFSVVSRKPTICDMKPVQVEVAIARLQERSGDSDNPVGVLRFANRVPLQFDKSACAIVKAITSVNWKSYGLRQSRGLLPIGPYIMAVSVISPFIKFKNASKETIDAADDLVTEIRRALMTAGQRLSRHLKREHKAKELEAKTQHIEKFSPILVETLCRILEAPKKRKERAELGLKKILGRDHKETEKQLAKAEERLSEHLAGQKKRLTVFQEEDSLLESEEEDNELDQDNQTKLQTAESELNTVASSEGKKSKSGAIRKKRSKANQDKTTKKSTSKKAVKKAGKKVTKKVGKKTSKKVTKKVEKKNSKKVAKKVEKKTNKKPSKKVVKKAGKKETKNAPNKTSKKPTKKVVKKSSKRVEKKNSASKKKPVVKKQSKQNSKKKTKKKAKK